MSRHLSAKHGLKRKSSTWLQDHVRRGLMLQSWDRNGAYGYWIVEQDGTSATHSSVDSSLQQTSAPRLQRLEQLHLEGLNRVNSRRTDATNGFGKCDMALNTNWMRRTGWAETFAGAERRLLVRLAQFPVAIAQDLHLGLYGSLDLYSCKEDEYRLSLLVAAMDQVFDRCEDTVRHTDVSIRCLLRSSYPDRTYKATTQRYRRIFKMAVCFCVRLWRLDRTVRQRFLRRSFTDEQDQSLHQLWSNQAWSLMPKAKEPEPRTRQTESGPTTVESWE